MKIKHLFRSILLLTIALQVTSLQSRAAITSYTDSGELLLGFRKAGASNDYLLKVGLASALPTSGSTTFSLGSIATDLQAAFGSSWFTDTGSSTVFWSVFGDNASGNGILYTGRATSTPWPTFNVGATSTAFGNVQQVTGDYNNQFSTANSTVGWLEPASDPFSYASYQPGGSNAFGVSFAAWSPTTEAAVSQSMFLQVMPLNAGGSTTTTQVPGFFSITSTGALSYTANAVPEPSTYVSLALGAGLVVMALRRRSAKA